MTFPFYRLGKGGIVGLKPGEIPRILDRDPEHFLPKPCGAPPPPKNCPGFAETMNFSSIDDLMGAEGSAIMERILQGAMREATARAVATDLIRQFGVTLPIRALRARPRPMLWIEAMVLDKLEAVAQHLGTP